MPKLINAEWEKKFEEGWVKIAGGTRLSLVQMGMVVSFIKVLLLNQRKEMEDKVNKLERYDAWLNGFNVDMTNGYNRAIDDVKSLLKGE